MTMDEWRTLATTIDERLGLELGAWNDVEVRTQLARREGAQASGGTARYLQALAESPTELASWAEVLTAGETFFFRHEEQLRVFADVALPAALARARRPVRVLSVGCATGEEPYSLAILARERLGDGAPREVSILGIDINAEFIRRARLAQFSERALWRLPSPAYRALFRRTAQGYTLAETMTRGVSFEVRNLMAPDPAFWAPGAFDLILCRNVLIYFSERARYQVLEQLATALVPGGRLFLGPADALRAVPRALTADRATGVYAAREGLR